MGEGKERFGVVRSCGSVPDGCGELEGAGDGLIESAEVDGVASAGVLNLNRVVVDTIDGVVGVIGEPRNGSDWISI